MRARLATHRLTLFLLAMLLILASVPAAVLHAKAADDADASRFQFSAANPGPRALEDQTQNAIKREYVAAWKNMEQALDQNRADLLDQSFVGAEREQLGRQVDQQKKSGLATKLEDSAHHVDFVFYSPEGTAIELHDTVELQQQTVDGGKQVHSESTSQKYVVIFTLVGDRWKVRTLQQVASD